MRYLNLSVHLLRIKKNWSSSITILCKNQNYLLLLIYTMEISEGGGVIIVFGLLFRVLDMKAWNAP